jgi:hypothetical protein
MIGGTVMLLALTAPAFSLMAYYHSMLALLGGTGVLAFFVGAISAAITTNITESLPVGLRAGSLGIIYALAISSFGGTAQFVVTWLIAVTGSPLAPAWYMSAALLLGLAGMLPMPETAPSRKS